MAATVEDPRKLFVQQLAEEEHAPKGGPAELRDLLLLASTARVEHYEMAAYEPLLTMAKAMARRRWPASSSAT